ncbi:unnamed protein product [Rotaria sordida]|uniref:EF-hand domain-containing protein n=1 Tax=Rotaria sordida TaxID=392033 RepID=A0A814JD32_9BILA|nr:unnamed protein product [Rotaria sordida]
MHCSFFILLVITIINLISSSHHSNPGHLQPFGTVGSLINIEEINGEHLNILKFFTNYISKLEPIVFRQVLINNIHYNIWQTDEQLENEIDGLSKINIYVESLKQRQRIQMEFGDFLDKYEKENLLFADNLPEILRKYLVVPQPLQCDEVLPTLQSAILVINGKNTSPLMFNQEYDSILCLLRGNKRMVLVNTNKYPDVRQIIIPGNRQSRRPPINLEKVDFNQYPELENIDYYVTNLTAGDCLFIPNEWIFQERSLDKTISIIYNIDHKQILNINIDEIKICSTKNIFDSSFTLDQIDWSKMENEPQNLKEIIISLVNSKSNNFEKWQETFSKYFSFDLSSDSETAAIFDEFYGIIDIDGNGEITMNEVEQINGAHQHHISDVLYEMIKLAHDKQKDDLETKINIEDENTQEILENEELKDTENENMDEHLHLQNFKTDL